MFYSVDLLRIRGAKKGRLPRCWIAATTTDFVGQGKTKVSKKDILDFDICAACDDILHRVTTQTETDRFSLYLSSQLSFGAVKIFGKQVDFLFEDCERLLSNIFSNKSVPQKSRKNKKPKLTGDDEDAPLDLDRLFPTEREDIYQLNELPNQKLLVELPVFEFDDPIDTLDLESEIRARSSPNVQIDGELAYQELIRFGRENEESPPQREDEAAELRPETREVLEAHFESEITANVLPYPVSPQQMPAPVTPVTPKRKSRVGHHETPTKKKKMIGTDDSSNLPKTPTTSRLQSSANVSETARSPITLARRLNFEPDQPIIDAAVPMENLARFPVPPNEEIIEAADLRSEENIRDENILINNDYLAPPNLENEVHTPIHTKQIQKSVVNTETFEVQMDIDVPASIQPPPNENLPASPVNVELNLETLDESLASVNSGQKKARKRRRQQNWFDEQKQIAIIFPPTRIDLHTKSKESTLVHFNSKLTTKQLLKMPARLYDNQRSFHTNIFKWSKQLQQNFEAFIENPCQDTRLEHNNSLNITERNISDRYVNKQRPKRSDFRPKNDTVTPDQSSRWTSDLLHQETENIVPNPALYETSSPLRPPAPDLVNEQPCVEENRQIPEFMPQDNIEIENHDNVPRNQVLSHSTDPESDETFLPKRQINPPNEPMEEESVALETISQQNGFEENLILSRAEFYKVLLKMWKIVDTYIQDDKEPLHIKLDSILNKNNSIYELYYYLIYLFELEKKRKLHLKQEYVDSLPIWESPIRIIKLEKAEAEEPE